MSSSCEFDCQGGFGAFCLKMCDFLAQQDKFSTTLRSILVICKVRNECNLPWIFIILSGFFSCFNKLAFEAEFLLDFRITITNLTLFRRKQKKPGGFEEKTEGRKRSLKTGGFWLKWEGWNLWSVVASRLLFLYILPKLIYILEVAELIREFHEISDLNQRVSIFILSIDKYNPELHVCMYLVWIKEF